MEVGKATVRLAYEGCKVVLIGRNRKSLDKVAEIIQEKKERPCNKGRSYERKAR